MKSVIEMLPPRALVSELEVQIPLFQPCDNPTSKSICIRQAAKKMGVDITIKKRNDGLIIIRLS